MKLMKSLIATAAVVCMAQANAVPVASIGVAPATFDAFSMSTVDAGSQVTSAQMGSVANQWLKPLGVSDTLPYMVVSMDGGPPPLNGSATITFGAPVDTYSFLWGSPDDYNNLTFKLADNTTWSFSGADLGLLGGFSANGDNANTKWVTFTSDVGNNFTGVTFASSGVAFEVASVSAVPEPETYALMLAGLAAVGFVARRRRKA